MPVETRTGLISDVVISLPEGEVQSSSGLAFDIGSTIGKIIYRSNKEYKDGRPINPKDADSLGQVHFAMFPRADVSGMVEYIKEQCDLTANSEGVIIVKSSGVGGANFQKPIETGLNCKMEILSEGDCFVNAFKSFKKRVPEEELCWPLPADILAELEALKKQMEEMMESVKDEEFDVDFKFEDTGVKEEDRGTLLVMAGSGTGIMEIKPNGDSCYAEAVYLAGRSLYGLSSILSGENDFDKLKDMAEKADGKTADTWMSDLIQSKDDEEDNMYTKFSGMGDQLMFPFGKGCTNPSSGMKKEDLVFSVFNTVAMVHAGVINTTVKSTKAKDVYFVGNTFNTEIMRRLASKAKGQMSMLLPKDLHYEYHFIRNGGMYGALGAYLHTKKEENTRL